MRSKVVLLTALTAAVTLASASTGYAAGPPLTVAKTGDTSGCAHQATYHTIQAAVNAASAGSMIQVCPGTYQEYVFIPSTLNNLTIKGMGPNPDPTHSGAPVILFPTIPNSQSLAALQTDSLVTVDGASNVTLQGLEVSGPWYDSGCEPYTASHVGVYAGGNGQANLKNDYVTDIQAADQAGQGGCQDGFAVDAGNQLASTPDPGAITIQNSFVDRYQKDGILIDGGASAASSNVMNNTVTGVGPTNVIASNGIEFDDSSTGQIANNTVSANQYTGPTYQSTGILMYAPGANVAVHDNKMTANDIGIYAYQPGSGLAIHDNQITGDTNSDSENIELDDVTGGQVHDNHLTGGAYGLDAFDSTNGVLIANNQSSNASAVGIWDEATATGNTYMGNKASGSGTYDCEDDTTGSGTAATANTWKGDHGTTSHPAGICTK